VRYNLDMDIVACIREARDKGANDGREDEELGDGRIGKSGGYHGAHMCRCRECVGDTDWVTCVWRLAGSVGGATVVGARRWE